jgi:Mrp family chromosome partitioning ATPase
MRLPNVQSKRVKLRAPALSADGVRSLEMHDPRVAAQRTHGTLLEPSHDLQCPVLDEGLRAESLRLAHRLFLQPRNDSIRAVVFCPADGTDASFEVCARVGATLAGQAVGTVCLVDADTRAPRLHRYFGVANAEGGGFATFVSLNDASGLHAYLHRDSNLWFMPAGLIKRESSPVVSYDQLKGCISKLRAEFDYVLLQSPSVTEQDDAISLGRLSDGVVLVIDEQLTKRTVALKAKEKLVSNHIRMLGAVLNNRSFPIPDAIYRRFC